jgi:hypothetical protein
MDRYKLEMRPSLAHHMGEILRMLGIFQWEGWDMDIARI